MGEYSKDDRYTTTPRFFANLKPLYCFHIFLGNFCPHPPLVTVTTDFCYQCTMYTLTQQSYQSRQVGIIPTFYLICKIQKYQCMH